MLDEEGSAGRLLEICELGTREELDGSIFPETDDEG